MSDMGRGAARWSAWCLIAGGVAMAALWLVFTWSHGPTSFNENRLVLGRDMHFWGMLLGVVPNGLVAAGLVGIRRRLLSGAGRTAGIGYVLVVGALVASGAIDLLTGSLGPPLLMPVQGAGLVLLGVASDEGEEPRHRRGLRRTLLAVGGLLLAAFAFALLPLEVTDAFGGYRIFGAVAHVAAGTGWLVAGILAARTTPTVVS